MTLLKVPPGPDGIVEDPWTAPFWSAARSRRLVVCECADCHTLRMPPGPFCPHCQSQKVSWRDLPGTGHVYTYTIVVRALATASASQIPYAPAVIALDGAPGIRLVSAVIGCVQTRLCVGAPVQVSWHALSDGHLVPYFSLD